MSRIILSSIIVLLFLTNVLAQDKLLYETGVTLTKEASELIQQEKYDEAINVFQKISPNDSLYKNSFVAISYYHILQKQYDQALSITDEGLKIADPISKQSLYLNRGTSYEGLEKYTLAKENYENALKEYPRSHKLRYNLSRINEKLGENEEAFKNLNLSLEANPFFENAFLQLGNMYRKQNKRSQALLLYNLYLLCSPDGESSFQVLQLANNMVNTIKDIDSDIYDITKDDDLFENHNLIIESKLALQKDFKNSNELNIAFTKQTFAVLKQLEKETFKGKSTLWANKIIPFYKWIYENGHFNNLSYTAAYSIENEEYNKITTKKTEDIKEFLPIAYSMWSELFSRDQKENNGTKVAIMRSYDDDGLITGEGQVNSQDNPIGKWLYYNTRGQVIAKGTFVKGDRDGNWEWFYDNGTLKEKGSYSKGIEQGNYQFFHENGNKKIDLNFKDGAIDGLYELYSSDGALQEKRNYKAGKMDGMRHFFYKSENELLSYEYSLKNDIVNGPYKEFYPNGTLAKEATLVNDYFEGEEKIYHYNGQLSATATYKKGEYTGPFKAYHNNGEIESMGSYINGELNGEYKIYYRNGVLQEKKQFEAGKLEGPYLTYDKDGILLSNFNYKNGLLKEYTFYDKTGDIIESQKKKSGELYYKGYNNARTLISEGLYDIKGGKKGEWTFYNIYGVITERGTYKENKAQGIHTSYYHNGNTKEISNYKDDILEGYEVTYYPFGQIKSQSYYKDGLRDGRTIIYHPDGKIQIENYYHKGQLYGEQKYFSVNGQLVNTSYYDLGVLISETMYKKNGSILEKIDKLSPKEGLVQYHYENGKVKSSSVFKYGTYLGDHKEYDFYGNLNAEGKFVNNELDGSVKTYYSNGNIKSDRLYSKGLFQGVYVDYYENGKVEDSTYYENGYQDGVSKSFNEEGIKTGDMFYVDGQLHRERKFYGEEKGALQLIRYYEYGKLLGYSYLDTSGEEIPMIELPNATGKVISYFQNGSKGREMTYKNGLNQGNYKTYYENGQLESDYDYIDNEINGVSSEYYSNGKLKSETNYFNGYLQGNWKMFYENGNIKEQGNYNNDQLEGERHYFNEKGKKTKTEVYFNGNIIKSQSF